MTIEIVLTALPHTTARGPRVSVFASFRLDPGAAASTLEHFDGFPWPELLAGSELAIVDEGGNAVARERVSAAPSIRHWRALFPPETPVRAWSLPDQRTRPIRSAPMRLAESLVHGLYTASAQAAGESFPSALDPGVQSYRAGFARYLRLRKELERQPLTPAQWRATHDTASRWSVTLAAAEQLFAPERSGRALLDQQYRRHGPTITAPEPPQPDFHDRVAMLSDHPSLLRALGVVVDLAVDREPAPSGTLRVVAGGRITAFTLRTPDTAFVFDGRELSPAPGPLGDTERAWLRVGDRRLFTVYRADLDGALQKLLVHGGALAATEPRDGPGDSLPAVRTGAITVARNDRADATRAALTRAVALQAGGAGALTIDDVRRGYRVDVHLDAGWRSLCRRTQSGTVGDLAWEPAPDDIEGYVRGGGGTSDTGDPTDALRVHEALFSWDGWSLVVPRPGRPIDDVPRKRPDAGPIAFDLTSQVPRGTLPRLRFGRSYRVRARVVDLAGNSLPPEAEAPQDCESAEVPWVRYEPVPAPVVVPRARFTEGGSLERLVIRSAGGATHASAADYAATDEARDRGYAARDARHLAPPKVSQITAEQHGMLDGVEPAAAFWMSAREQGALGDTFVIGPTGPTYRKLEPGAVVVINAGPEAQPYQLPDGQPFGVDLPLRLPDDLRMISQRPDPTDPTRVIPIRGNPLEHGQYIACPGALEVPWLPDPLARGATLWSPEKDLTAAIEYPRPARWPLVSPCALVLREGHVALDADRDTLALSLPPATIVTLRLSTLPERDRLPTMAWFTAAAGHDEARASMAHGHHWLVTPWREITFVHAVEKPLRPPAPDTTAGWQRVERGDAFAVLDGVLRVHGHSTGHVDLYARWSDAVDLASTVNPETDRVEREGHVTQLDVQYDETEIPLLRRSPEGDEPVRHELGDTRHHEIAYTLAATTRYREYFAAAITDDPERITRSSDALTVTIRSSASPDAPKPLYALPTFRWESGDDPTRKQRIGRALRVWLDRPWWSSGDGELLAVALPLEGVRVATDAPPCVTEWGADPRRAEAAPAGPPQPESFPNAARVGGPFELPGTGGVKVRVAGFTPHFDVDRGLWYADIEVDTGTLETPFVRLALCRWQPDSLANVELSPVVRMDFVQVLADRTASVTWGPDNVTVTVSRSPAPLGNNPAIASRVDLGAIREGIAHLIPVARQVIGREVPIAHVRPEVIAARESWVGWDDPDLITTVELQGRADGAVGDLGWHTLARPGVGDLPGRRNQRSGEEQWHGMLRWPGIELPKQRRLVVRQFERYEADPLGAPVTTEFPKDRRLSFVAIFEVPQTT